MYFSAESYGLAAEAYSDALEGCKKTSKRVEDKFVHKMQEANVSRPIHVHVTEIHCIYMNYVVIL